VKARESRKELEKKKASDTTSLLGGRQVHDRAFESRRTEFSAEEVGNAEEFSCRPDKLNASCSETGLLDSWTAAWKS
jgi:hypothetical protein